MLRKITLFFFLFAPIWVLAQEKDTTKKDINNRLVQFSGVIITADSLQPLPYVNIIDKNTGRGTVSDYYGFFSFVALKGDTIIFSSVGMKRSTFVIPDSLNDDRYSLIQMMQSDTILLKESVVYPWPSREQFAQAFIDLEIPDDYVARAERNMQLAELKERAGQMPNDPYMAYRNTMRMEQTRLYYAGQVPPNNLLNPIAWYKFIEAWKRGDFKKQ